MLLSIPIIVIIVCTVTIIKNNITFDYKIKEGPSTSRNAIKLLKYLNFDDKIITDANQRVKYFTANKKWE